MTNGLNLPFKGDLNTWATAFEIEIPEGGGFAIIGRSNGPGGFLINGVGVYGETGGGLGVWGVSMGNGIAVVGTAGNGPGVQGNSTNGPGVEGKSEDSSGVHAYSMFNNGIFAEGGRNGVEGASSSPDDSGVWGHNDTTVDNPWKGYGVAGTSDKGIGIYGKGGKLAGRFEGDVEVTGDIRLMNQDCAEDFDISIDHSVVDPGTVMVLNHEGQLEPSQREYDKRVAGVISGAGGFKPGVILGRQSSEANNSKRVPIAMMGKVFCKVDANFGPIEVGDLLTTSPTLGHAMKADDPCKAFGTVIGKALSPLNYGQAMIPILVALQ